MSTTPALHELAQRIAQRIDGDFMGDEMIAEIIAEHLERECDRRDGCIVRTHKCYQHVDPIAFFTALNEALEAQL